MKAIDTFNYCPACGDPRFERCSAKSRTCSACGFVYYFNCGAAVAVIVERQGEFLLTVRAKAPGKGLFGLPGGFVDDGESLEDAVRRETVEELGLALGDLAYLGSFPNTYPYKGIDVHTSDACFLARISDQPEMVLSDEIAAVEWFAPDSMPLEQIAFESLRKAVEMARRQLGSA